MGTLDFDSIDFSPGASWTPAQPSIDAVGKLAKAVKDLCAHFHPPIGSKDDGPCSLVGVVGSFDVGTITTDIYGVAAISYGDTTSAIDRIAGWELSKSSSSTHQIPLTENLRLRLHLDRASSAVFVSVDGRAVDYRPYEETKRLWTALQLCLVTICDIVVLVSLDAALSSSHASILRQAHSSKATLTTFSDKMHRMRDVVASHVGNVRNISPSSTTNRIPALFAAHYDRDMTSGKDSGRTSYLRPVLRELGILGVDPSDSQRAIVCLSDVFPTEYDLSPIDRKGDEAQKLRSGSTSLLDYIVLKAEQGDATIPQWQTPKDDENTTSTRNTSNGPHSEPRHKQSFRNVLTSVAKGGTSALFRGTVRGEARGGGYGVARGYFAPLRGRSLGGRSAGAERPDPRHGSSESELPTPLQCLTTFALLGLCFSMSDPFGVASLHDTHEELSALKDVGTSVLSASKTAADSDSEWSESHCQDAEDKAVVIYGMTNPERPLYGTDEHKSRLSAALNVYRRLARGPARKQHEATLVSRCDVVWKGDPTKGLEGKRKCEEMSFLDHECEREVTITFLARQHMTEKKVRQSCDCGRYMKARSEPFDASSGNYLALSCCPQLGNPARLLPSTANDLQPLNFISQSFSGDEQSADTLPALSSAESVDWAWSLVRVASHSYFDRQDGVVKGGTGWGVLFGKTAREQKAPPTYRESVSKDRGSDGKERAKRRKDDVPSDGSHAPRPTTLASFIDLKSLSEDRTTGTATASSSSKPSNVKPDSESHIPKDQRLFALEYEALPSTEKAPVRVLGRSSEKSKQGTVVVAQLMRIKVSVGELQDVVRLSPTVSLSIPVRNGSGDTSANQTSQSFSFSPTTESITLPPGTSTVLRLPYIYVNPHSGEPIRWPVSPSKRLDLHSGAFLRAGWLVLGD
ncbi:Protein smg8 [Gonapodya sp. JEL0774]|nr:Protein smg8 [Gonapodya sp. JEL0774]